MIQSPVCRLNLTSRFCKLLKFKKSKKQRSLILTDQLVRPEVRKFTALDKIKIKKEPLPNSVVELENLLTEEGVDISAPSFQRQIEVREKELIRRNGEKKDATRNRPEGYKTIRDRSLAIRDYFTIGFNFIFVVLFMVLGIVTLFVSEVYSSALGIATFFKEPVAALLLSFTLVAVYFAIEWRHASLTHKHGNPPSYRFSISMIIRRLRYFFSFNPNQELELTNRQSDIRNINRVRMVLILMIIGLGILGRLESLLQTEQGIWYETIIRIATESNLQTFLEYFFGGFLALALLSATHWLVSYIYEIYSKAVGVDEVDFFDPLALEREREQMITALYRHKLSQIWESKEEQVIQNYQKYQAQRSDNSTNT